MVPRPLTRQRCLDQAHAAREAAAAAATSSGRDRLIHIAVAYETLASKAR